MKKIITITSLILLLQSCVSYKEYNQHLVTPIPVKKLIKDIDYVEKKLTRMHPDLYWYVSKEELHSSFDSLRNNLKEPLTPNEFQLKIAPIVAKVKQGHISLRPLMPMIDKKAKDLKKYEKSKGPFSQLSFYWNKGEWYIQQNHSKVKSIKKGSKVLSINNITPQYLYHKYKKTITTDGYIQTFIDKRFNMSIINYYGLELGVTDSITLELNYKDSLYSAKIYREFKDNPSSNTAITTAEIKDSIQTPKNSSTENSKKNTIPNTSKNNRIYGYDYKLKLNSKQLSYPVAQDSTIVILSIRNFSKGSAKKAYKNIFSEIKSKNVGTLVLDLRGNLGGKLSDIQNLYSYLATEEEYQFVQPAKVTSRLHTPFYAIAGKPVWNYVLLSPYYAGYSVYLWTSTYKKDGEYFYKLEGSRKNKAQKERFEGMLYVLIDGATYSASSILSSNLKGTKRAIFVGEETGGAYNGTVAGRMPKLDLPNSKLKFSLGIMTIRPCEQTNIEGRGIFPDIEIIPTVDQAIQKQDPVMEWVLEHYKEHKPL